MRVELATATSGPGIATVPRARARRWRIDGFEAVLLVVFGLLSVWVLGLDLFQVIAHGRVWTGTDGLYLVDQMQYLAWVQSASHHLLIANLFVLRPTPADYFQPAIAISGGLSALGLAPWLALLLWKPIAVVSFFFAVRAFVYRSIQGLWPRRAALTLALFFGSFTIVYGELQRPRRSVAGVPVVGLRVRAARARGDRRCAAPLRHRAPPREGGVAARSARRLRDAHAPVAGRAADPARRRRRARRGRPAAPRSTPGRARRCSRSG